MIFVLLVALDATWVGPFANMWTEDQCKIVRTANYLDDFVHCSEACENNNQCNAINLGEGDLAGCQLLKCPYNPHVVAPSKNVGGYRGFCVVKDMSVECKKQWNDDCTFQFNNK